MSAEVLASWIKDQETLLEGLTELRAGMTLDHPDYRTLFSAQSGVISALRHLRKLRNFNSLASSSSSYKFGAYFDPSKGVEVTPLLLPQSNQGSSSLSTVQRRTTRRERDPPSSKGTFESGHEGPQSIRLFADPTVCLLILDER